MDESKLLTLSEISELTRLPVSTLRHYRQRGVGPPTFRVGRRVVARASEVQRWLDEQRVRELGA